MNSLRHRIVRDWAEYPLDYPWRLVGGAHEDAERLLRSALIDQLERGLQPGIFASAWQINVAKALEDAKQIAQSTIAEQIAR